MKRLKGRIEGDEVRGRPRVQWINRVSEYWSERVESSRIDVRGSARTGGDRDTSAAAPPGGKFSRGSKGSEI